MNCGFPQLLVLDATTTYNGERSKGFQGFLGFQQILKLSDVFL